MTAKPPHAKPIAIRSRTYDAIMEISVEHPLMTPGQIAALLGRNSQLVTHIMRSDEFLERRASLILERYGDKIQGVRAKFLEAAALTVDAIMKRISDPNSTCSEQTLLDAGQFLMKYVMPQVPDANVAAQHQPPQTHMNFFINPADAIAARERQALHARTINSLPQPSAAPQLSHVRERSDEKSGA